MALFGSLLRSSSALWVAPLAIALAIWYANKSAIYAPFDPYLVQHTAAGADPLFLTLAVVAACAAWEGGRLRRAGWIGQPNARQPLAAVAPMLLPPLVVGLAAAAAGLIWKLHLGGVGLLPDLRFMPTLLVVVSALVLLGFAIGTRVPVVIAAPAILVGVYLWLAIPGSISEPIWLRHLPGSELGSCCGLESDIDARALLAPILVSVGMIASAYVLLFSRPSFRFSFVALLITPLVLGISGGVALAHGLSRDPVVPRSAASLVCADSSPRVCVWPEHSHLLADAAALAPEVAAAWSRNGVAPPDVFTEATVDAASGNARNFAVWSGANTTNLRQAFALSMMPEWPACAESSDEGQVQPAYLGDEAFDYVLAWFEATAGVPSRALNREFGRDDPAILETIDQVRSLPPAQQTAWLERNLAALASCDLAPQLEPPR